VTTRRKTGSVFALGMRVVRLGPTGVPLVGADNAYETDNLVKLDFTMAYRDGDEKSRQNGAGRNCLYYQAPSTVQGLTVNALELCYPDPELQEFLGGGDVLVDDDDDPVGFAAPEIGADPSGNGVGIELWSSAIHDDGVDDTDPYIRWLFPREKLRETSTNSISSDPLAPSYEGTGQQNAGYGNGPMNDWLYTSNRVYQWYRTPTIPDLSANGLIVVPPDAP
jgi:hypothetical protein